MSLMSRPAWARGLKHCPNCDARVFVKVAPRMGAWIETENKDKLSESLTVAPRMGAWIETGGFVKIRINGYVAPRMGAWIETF